MGINCSKICALVDISCSKIYSRRLNYPTRLKEASVVVKCTLGDFSSYCCNKTCTLVDVSCSNIYVLVRRQCDWKYTRLIKVM